MTHRKKRNTIMRACGTALGALLAMPAAAQVVENEETAATTTGDAADIVVTAQRREQKIADTSASVSAFSAERLVDIGVRSAGDLAQFAPSLVIVKSAQVNQIAIRGLGSPGLDDFESAVGFYVDGVYTSKSRNALTPFFDMRSVEVLRGPQGVLFGKNALAGVVSIASAEPDTDFGGYGQIQGGSRSLIEAEGAVTGSPMTGVSLRVAGLYRNRGGYLHDLAPGKHEGGEQHTRGLRLRANIDLGAASTLKLKYEWFRDFEYGYTRQLTAVGPADAINPAFDGIETRLDDRLFSGQPGLYNVNSRVGTIAHAATAAFDHRLGSGDTLGLVVGYGNFNHRLRRGDALPIATLLQENPTRNETLTAELRLTSAANRRFRYIVGAYGDLTWTHRTGRSILDFSWLAAGIRDTLVLRGLPAPLLPSAQGFADANTLVLGSPFTQRGKSWALFGEASFDMTSALTLTAGLRYSWDRTAIVRPYDASFDIDGRAFASVASYAGLVPRPGLQIQPGVTVEQLLAGTFQSIYRSFLALPGTSADRLAQSRGRFQPAFRIEYRPAGGWLLYGTVQTGTKQGGFNASALTRVTRFGNEKAFAAEVGAKWDFGSGYATLAAFRTRFSDLQVSATNTTGAVDTLNAANAVSQGIEAELAYRIAPGTRIGGTYAYLDAHYRRFPNAPCTVDQLHATPRGQSCSQDLAGKRLPNAPTHSIALYADTRQPLGDALELGLSADLGWKSATFTEITDTPQQRSDALTLLNARIELKLTRVNLSFALLARNLLDDRGALIRQRAANARDPGTILSVINEPRSFAVQARIGF